ncbi:HvfA family oxazolone/thioamide-modified RiPP metallophore [Calditrichota bacterium LG25]
MSKTTKKESRSKKLIKLASSAVLMSAVAGFSAQANAGNYSVMGSGSEVREALSAINSLQKPAELGCGAMDSKTTKDTKTSEGKCGEGKCGGEMKEAKNKEAKAVKESAAKKVESKTSEAKCGGEMMKTKSKDVKKADEKDKKADSKTSEAKCGEGKSDK